ncbi:hypothetical protein V1477_010827, partial [Vespula maculifrons]
ETSFNNNNNKTTRKKMFKTNKMFSINLHFRKRRTGNEHESYKPPSEPCTGGTRIREQMFVIALPRLTTGDDADATSAAVISGMQRGYAFTCILACPEDLLAFSEKVEDTRLKKLCMHDIYELDIRVQIYIARRKVDSWYKNNFRRMLRSVMNRAKKKKKEENEEEEEEEEEEKEKKKKKKKMKKKELRRLDRTSYYCENRKSISSVTNEKEGSEKRDIK